MNDGKGANKPYQANAYHDVEAANPRVERREKYVFGGSSFNTEWEKQIRIGFIRKVYGILSTQLLVMFAGVYMCTTVDSIRNYVQENAATLWIAYIMMIVLICTLVCCGDMRRKVPTNYLLLGAFTLCATYLAGVVSSFYDTQVVLLAMGATFLTVIGLTIFACQTKIDFTMMGGSLFCALWLLMIFGFMQIWFHSQFLNTVYSIIGAGIFCVYIVYDTQLIVGGKHKKFKLSEDEYIFAALNLFLDVLNLFLFLLAILGGGSRRR